MDQIVELLPTFGPEYRCSARTVGRDLADIRRRHLEAPEELRERVGGLLLTALLDKWAQLSEQPMDWPSWLKTGEALRKLYGLDAPVKQELMGAVAEPTVINIRTVSPDRDAIMAKVADAGS